MTSRRHRCYQHAAQAWDTWTSTPIWRFRKRRRAYRWFRAWERAYNHLSSATPTHGRTK